MSFEINRPYLVLPLLIEQPTWGGSYIATYKKIIDSFSKQKIGQSYELFSGTIFSTAFSTSDKQFITELLAYNQLGRIPPSDCISLQNLVQKDPANCLGPTPINKKPLLIKFTQALGNSFQLHIKKSQTHSHWQAKPESWYYLEDGIVTYGIKKGADLAGYKLVCIGIEKKMQDISLAIKNKKLSYEEAKKIAQEYIKKANPWQFVNVHKIKKHSVVDLSPGGIHHSWEEDPVASPLGNVLYEVQADVMDENCTIRSFDKGKILPDGSIRPIHIEDYFSFLETNPEHNDLQMAMKKRNGQSLVKTPYYSLGVETLGKTEVVEETKTSYIHIFVVEGELHLDTSNYSLIVEKGCSCFIPFGVGRYLLSSGDGKTTILKTYIE